MYAIFTQWCHFDSQSYSNKERDVCLIREDTFTKMKLKSEVSVSKVSFKNTAVKDILGQN